MMRKRSGFPKIVLGVGGLIAAATVAIFATVIGSMVSGYKSLSSAKEFTETNPRDIMDLNNTAQQLSEMGYFGSLRGAQFVDDCRMKVLRDTEELKTNFNQYLTVEAQASRVTECVIKKGTELSARTHYTSSNDF